MVYVGLGGNEDNTLEVFVKLKEDFESNFPPVRFSSLYKSRPLMDIDQDSFWNAVVELDPQCSPLEFLVQLQAWEREYGRIRNPLRPKGPRVIDLDLLLWHQETIRSPELVVPHERMHEREFVLKPLLELNPKLVDPTSGIAYARLATALMNQGVYLQSESW